GGRNLEEAPRLDDLAAAAAVVARGRHGALAGARALTLAAKLLPVHIDGPRRAPRRLEQLDLELQEQVRTRSRPAATVAEEVAEQPTAKDIAERRHDI